jgi:PIN domain nuclease of toxin-antitoxin system
VGAVASSSAISAVNVQEVAKSLIVLGMPPALARDMLTELKLDVIPHDAEQAWAAASLVHATRSIGSGLGDRTCMALAISLGIPAMTADRAWAKLDVPGLRVVTIR